MSGALNGKSSSSWYWFELMLNLFHLSLATLTNQDGSEDRPSLVFDSARNVLSFTHDVNRSPATELPVVRIFSVLLLLLRLITASAVHLPFRLDLSCNISPYPFGYEHFFLGLLVSVYCIAPLGGP